MSSGQNVIGQIENVLYQNERSVYSSLNSLEVAINQIANTFLELLNKGFITMWPSVYQIPVKFKTLANDPNITARLQQVVGKFKTVKDAILEIPSREYRLLENQTTGAMNIWRSIIISSSYSYLTSTSPKLSSCLRTYEGTYSRLLSQAYNALSSCTNQISKLSATLTRNYSSEVRSFQTQMSKMSTLFRLCASKSSEDDARTCVINTVSRLIDCLKVP